MLKSQNVNKKINVGPTATVNRACVLWMESVIHIVTADSTHMQDLQEVTQEIHYENFRSEKLAESGGTAIRKLRSVASPNRNVQHIEMSRLSAGGIVHHHGNCLQSPVVQCQNIWDMIIILIEAVAKGLYC